MIANKTSSFPFDTPQIELHHQFVEPELWEFCRQHQIQVQAWSPLMHGQVFQVPQIVRIAAGYGKSPAQVVLRWELQQGVATVATSVRRKHLTRPPRPFSIFNCPGRT